MTDPPPSVVPAARMLIPRWIQLVGLPLLLLLLWAVAGAVRHAVFLFLVASIVALLLNPLVRVLTRLRIPRGFGVAIVYLSFATILVVASVAVATVVMDQTRSASDRIDTYLTKEDGQTGETEAERDVDRFQAWLDTHRLGRIQVRKQGRDFVDNIGGSDVQEWSTRVLNWAEGAALGVAAFLFGLVLVLVASIYMLLDMPRFQRALDRRFPPPPGSPSLLPSVERAVGGYVKGQLLVSAIIGASAGVGVWLLGTLGWFPNGDTYAVLFGAWVAFTELIPYLGPWLGAIPPVTYALVINPISALWVALLFLAIHQIEGHIVVPNVMGSALRLHPLLVIFGLLAGAEIYGLPGVFVALPTLAAVRAIWDYFSPRIALEPWRDAGPGPVPVEVEPHAAARR
ncbi:MAG TPA: AI-2E family transporter [Gaiellaceae bacterium]|nr:AI-2E family transporter [Gaiellaceae bacterium]